MKQQPDFIPLDIPSLRAAYENNRFNPEQLVDYLLQRSSEYTDHNIWITPLSKEQIRPYLDALKTKELTNTPLYGVPFAIKDNIDLSNIDTTAACEQYRYRPDSDAFIVRCLIDAGAIPMGKTNMDQFATGLVGTRSPEPWGACKNSLNRDYISGGSSSGSAVAVALGLVSFSLGTDTAGSGRVPAMLNNIVGHKPSRGLFSMSGVVPACRSLDCPSVFALTAADAKAVFDVASKYDSGDSYARQSPYSNSARQWGEPESPPVIGVPLKENLEFFGDSEAKDLFWQAVKAWQEMGASVVEKDISPLLNAAKLLYEGPWVAERYAAIEDLMNNHRDAIHPVVRDIVAGAEGKTAVETFKFQYLMQDYRRIAEDLFADLDFLISPTAPTAFTVNELLDNPIELNSIMGYYTNYMNLLDLAGTAIPVGLMKNGVGFGVTLVAPAMSDQRLLSFAHQWQQRRHARVGALGYVPSLPNPPKVNDQTHIHVAVCGAHLTGMALNWQLTERNASFVERCKTSAHYQLYALSDGVRPGLKRVDNGAAIEIEIWAVPSDNFGTFVSNIPAPLGIGQLETEQGNWVSGFICEDYGLNDATNITEFGGWRAYLTAREAEK